MTAEQRYDRWFETRKDYEPWIPPGTLLLERPHGSDEPFRLVGVFDDSGKLVLVGEDNDGAPD